MGIVERNASTVEDFLAVCRELMATWSTTEGGGEPSLWYRGQKNAQWGLIPGEYRYQFINADEMRSEFM